MTVKETTLNEDFLAHLNSMTTYKFWYNLADFVAVTLAEGIDQMLINGTTAFAPAEVDELGALQEQFKAYADNPDHVIPPSTWELLGRWWPRLWD